MKRHYLQLALAGALLAMLAGVASGGAGVFELASQVPVSDAELATLRGGFTTPDGILVSFGITQATYVNGILDSTNSFTVTQGGSTGANPALQVASQMGNNGLRVIQIGPQGSNTFLPSTTPTLGLSRSLTVIQNTLNQQVITNSTVINASLANMGLVRDTNLSNALRQQMISGLH
ncbi:MAG: hypothetical protein P4L44_01830 [Oryzomonas sp.]|uniref:hypothetical protein n=1 Tax=Oryzomonas sp. TaxID=2855186 RepID=UPI00283C139A|nr:hypothetical protein [Oryzomonas sp.]MDR3578683.1 hypothetical protein [Oryzomonas sp.]